MPDIKTDEFIYFEEKLYLPMLIKILEKDLEAIDRLPFKLCKPYLKIVENALNAIRKDLKKAEIYLMRNNMKVVKWDATKEYIEYAFVSAGIEDHRRYTSEQMRDKTEELMRAYLTKI